MLKTIGMYEVLVLILLLKRVHFGAQKIKSTMTVIWEGQGLKVQKLDGMHSLVATIDYSVNDVVCIVEGEIIAEPNRYSVQVGECEHVNVEAPVKYINHGCDANIKLVGREFIATKIIDAGAEIIFNYCETEKVLAEPFVCFHCKQTVKGADFVAEYPCLK